jgi:hypothetical protein
MILVPHFSLHPLITSLPTGNTELKHSAAGEGGNERKGKEEEELVSTVSVTRSHKYFAVLKQAKLSISPGRKLWEWFRFEDKSLFYKLVVEVGGKWGG